MNNILWKPDPSRAKESKMALFMEFINRKYNLSIDKYLDLHNWSISSPDLFWGSVSDFFKIKYSSKAKNIINYSREFNKTKWFSGARLNYAENLLNSNSMNSLAIDFFNETGDRESLTYLDLSEKVASVSNLFRDLGLNKGDRVAAMMPNVPETIISSLASSTVGGIWSSCSPDFGNQAILERFEQINPKILILSSGYTFKGKVYDCTDKIKYLLSNLKSVNRIIIFNYKIVSKINHPKCIYWDDIDFKGNKDILFEEMNFDDPLYIMFSSGTTGKPKSIVHSVGGTLIQHVKELGLHTDLRKNEKILYYTTCGWMMWNWLLSGLYFESTIILYEGNPFYPEKDSLLKLLDIEGIDIFGTSAKYISYLHSENMKPNQNYKFKNLRLILSTGSTLTHENFDYVYNHINSRVQLSSISGGTDIISCFALGNPILEVRRGELQCIGLGMDVASYDLEGKSVKNKKGELVCQSPFPSMPIYFWNDKENERYYQSYFSKHKNVWTHGDFIEINNIGGVIIYGRSDATLNPGGIRIGTAEIYSAISELEYIEDSIAVNSVDGDSYVLFVKLCDKKDLSKNQLEEIEIAIRNNLSPKHIPSEIVSVSDIPYTINGKKVEIAVKKIIEGEEIDNLDSLSNPECLNEYSKLIKIKK